MDPSPSIAGWYSYANLETAEKYRAFTMLGCFIIGLFIMVLAAKYHWDLASPPPRLFLWMSCLFAATTIAYLAAEVLTHTYLDFLPNTCDAMIELAGPRRGNFSYPCQRDLLIRWFNQAITAGHFNVEQLLRIKRVKLTLGPVLGCSFAIALEEFARWAENRPIRLGDEKDMRELEEQKSVWGVCPHCSRSRQSGTH
ncbi:hypothetical protein M409DRAFT_27179 [Zasmidium cellare ATCC 36951]|uniref:Uncharacterized protein n=1 Tax=Zasmidium cellare ATCC 36951 TaxID=1080233 RepID=A0A6A6C5V9_ZASCE|nr:uncharacterized protein M409DRAFT_27179 [Zasmidium cellare ATCC 36951]KAF2162557.1 hypothetical protein M409DRAFT_27179 [Zasmidium cellare ATCC 36951]